MKDFSLIKSLVGENVTEDELKYVDCYPHQKFGLFIPSTGRCGYAARKNHSHPSYMVTIILSGDMREIFPDNKTKIKIKKNYYAASIFSPEIPHNDISEDMHYYCVMINKEYFESQYLLYSNEKPYFNRKIFSLCSDIIKLINIFMLEYSKEIQNSEITMNAQAELIVHWIIRSIIGENEAVRQISSDMSVARAQHYIERHFSENITVKTLAETAHISPSSLNRLFKKETSLTPIEYLIETRIEKSKIFLRRENVSITEAAMRCGFGSSAHFTSSFKRLTGITPSQYKDAYL